HSHTASILLTRPTQPLIPSTTLFRSPRLEYIKKAEQHERHQNTVDLIREQPERDPHTDKFIPDDTTVVVYLEVICGLTTQPDAEDRKSTRLNSSHVRISYAVFCLTKK